MLPLSFIGLTLSRLIPHWLAAPHIVCPGPADWGLLGVAVMSSLPLLIWRMG